VCGKDKAIALTYKKGRWIATGRVEKGIMFGSRRVAFGIASLLLFCSTAFAQEQPVYFASPKLQEVELLASNAASTEGFSSSLAESSNDGGSNDGSNDGGMIRPVPVPQAVPELSSSRPLRSLAFGFTANTLGAGVEVATPLSRSINLRSGMNFFSFAYPFNIDGVDYDARLHFQSSTSTLDWFPWHGAFHISPGVLYSKNALNAIASVGPGQNFELGDQPFLNSVDDPLAGNATVVFPHKVSPLLMIGVGNIIPRSRRRFSIPFEIGVAYTGAPVINVNLNGTACTQEGCVNFAGNADAQSSLRQEISTLNEDLKRFPVYPIMSLGFAYHF
jgi:hypothetical protein